MTTGALNDVTSLWLIDESDKRAVGNGCWFDVIAGARVVHWIETNCILYEGEHAGQPLILRGCHEDDIDRWWRGQEELDEMYALERAKSYITRRKDGAACDWQYEAIMRLYGWKRTGGLRRFRNAMFWVGKKNKKTPTAAANALYMTIGDSEPGNHVYIGARDGWQVRKNLMTHVINMIDVSPELSRQCKVHRIEYQVTHLPSKSTIHVLTSADKRTKDSKEGINGSVVLDELHVVERGLVRVVKRAGISRRQPIQLEISTAGDNPDSYGYERFRLGQRIINGEHADDSTLAMIYAVAPETTDAQIDEDPLKFGRIANPAFGHTVQETEFLDDYKQSRESEFDWPDFKRYRLNLWQSSVRRLITEKAWASCAGEFTEDELAGRWCIVGLDMSRKKDMTAAVALFPEYDEDGLSRLCQICRFWLPEAYARSHPEERFMAWAEQGALRLTDGDVIAVGDIYEQIEKWNHWFQIRALYFDPFAAEELTQLVSEGLRDRNREVLLDGLGLERVSVNQGGVQMARAIEDYEKAVRADILRHDNNPVMQWQWGNADVKDLGHKFKLVKPEYGSTKKIDGPVASIIAMAGISETAHEFTFKSFYEDHQMEFV